VTDPVPVQFFQSVIAIELAITGALLFQIHYFQPRGARKDDEQLPDPRIRVALALVLLATGLGSLEAIANEGGEGAASAVTLGLAISLVPILLRALPPVPKNRQSGARDPDYVVTLVCLALYALMVGLVVIALNV
jgi:hypothetical protein